MLPCSSRFYFSGTLAQSISCHPGNEYCHLFVCLFFITFFPPKCTISNIFFVIYKCFKLPKIPFMDFHVHTEVHIKELVVMIYFLKCLLRDRTIWVCRFNRGYPNEHTMHLCTIHVVENSYESNIYAYILMLILWLLSLQPRPIICLTLAPCVLRLPYCNYCTCLVSFENFHVLFCRITPFRNKSVDKWQKKTQVMTGAAAIKGKLHAFNQV